MKVYLDTCGMKFKKEISDLLDNEMLYNPNCNGMEYEILQDEFIYLDDVDNILGACLITKINNKIEELTYPE